MEYYLERSLARADRDTQYLFHWPDLWMTFRLSLPHVSFNDPAKNSHPLAVPTGECKFLNWCLHWTGWKQIPNTDILVGQWIAYDPRWHAWHLYSSYPGACGPFRAGYIFDISIKEGQSTPITHHLKTDMDSFKSECLWSLLMAIRDSGGEPPYKPLWERVRC